MKKLLTLLFTFSVIWSLAQTQINPSSSPTTTNINTAIKGSITASGTDTYTGTLTGATWSSGEAFDITFTNANTGSSTFQLNGGTTYTLKKYSSGSLVNLSSGDISAGERKRFYHNGTYLVMEGGTGSGSGAVSSVFGRTGVVTAQSNDYTFSQIGSLPTTLSGYGITDGLSTTLSSGHFFVGNGSNIATDVAMSGDATLSSSGAISIGSGKVTSSMLAGSIADGKLASSYLYADGTRSLTGDWAVGGYNITGVKSLSLSGTAGNGYISLPTQSLNPSAPAGGTVLFSNSNSKLSWRGSANNYIKTFDGGSLTADRVYSLPDVGGTVALIDGGQTFSSATWQGTAIADAYISSASNWNTAYTNRITSLTTTGSSGAATLSSNTLNIPNYTISGLGGWSSSSGSTLTGANTITGTSSNTLKAVFNSLGTTQTDGAGLWLQNSTAASSGNQQISPSITWEGQGWKTSATAASQSIKFTTYALPVQGTSVVLGTLRTRVSQNGGGYNSVGWSYLSDGSVALGASNGENAKIYPTSSFTGATIDSGQAGTFFGFAANIITAQPVVVLGLAGASANFTSTTGSPALVVLNGGFSPTSGNATFKVLRATNTINQTGGANGAVSIVSLEPTITAAGGDFIGLDYNPTTPSNISGNHYAAIFRSGKVGIGTATPSAKVHVKGDDTTTGELLRLDDNAGTNRDLLSNNGTRTLTGSVGINTSPSASAALEVSSTSKGFLPPKMTATQAEAISSPAEGLMIYSTNGTGSTITSKGWWGYDGTTWVKLN